MSFYNSLFSYFNKIVELRRRHIRFPFTKRNINFVFLLYQENYIDSFYCKTGFIYITFRVFDGNFSIQRLNKVAKKGQFKNVPVAILWKCSGSTFGNSLIHTSSGIMSEFSAKKLRKGGHFFCYIISLC